MRRLALVMVLVLLAGCSAQGRVEGPLLTSPRPGLSSGGEGAIVSGVVVYEEATGCLNLELGGILYPVVWPAGTRWQAEPPAVVLKGGVRAEPGTTVEGGGGYHPVAQVTKLAGPSVATEADRCVGETGEVAFFNLGSTVEVVAG